MLLSLLLHGLAFVALAIATPIFKRDFLDPEPVSGDVQGFVHDPSIHVFNGTYYLYTTDNHTNVRSAPSMSGPWKFLGPALSEDSVIDRPGRNVTWAPDLAKIGDTYYLYYSVSTFGAQEMSDIGVATSTTLEPGSWTDHGSIGIPHDKRYNRIDANLYLSGSKDSAPLLAFGSFNDGIFQVPMADPPLRIIEGSTYTHLQLNSTRRNTEGPYQFRWVEQGTQKSSYYLFFSGGACCNKPDELEVQGEEYRISVCRSESPSGPFTDKEGKDCVKENGGTLVLASHGDVYAPGGQGVFWDPEQEAVVIYYHYVKPSVSFLYEQFFFGWNKLSFEGGWPSIVS